MSKERNLKPLQEKFLEVLFEEAKGDPATAFKLAGYAGNNWYAVVRSLKDEIVERAKTYTALHGPKAVMETLTVMDEPLTPGAKEKLAAAEKIMDRGGLTKTEKVEIEGNSAVSIFALPEKREVNTADIPDDD